VLLLRVHKRRAWGWPSLQVSTATAQWRPKHTPIGKCCTWACRAYHMTQHTDWGRPGAAIQHAQTGRMGAFWRSLRHCTPHCDVEYTRGAWLVHCDTLHVEVGVVAAGDHVGERSTGARRGEDRGWWRSTPRRHLVCEPCRQPAHPPTCAMHCCSGELQTWLRRVSGTRAVQTPTKGRRGKRCDGGLWWSQDREGGLPGWRISWSGGSPLGCRPDHTGHGSL